MEMWGIMGIGIRGGSIMTVSILVGMGLAWWFWRAPTPHQTWITEPLALGRIASHVTAGGTVSALVTVLVGSQVSGRIQTLTADFNSPVRKGQVLATMDPLLFEALATQAAANLSAAEANLAKAQAPAVEARRQALRLQELFDQQVVTQMDLDGALTDQLVTEAGVKVAEAGIRQAQAALQQARANLAYTTISSPIDGIVISRSVDVGQSVAATFSTPTLFTIAEDLRKMQVDTNVAESDVGRITNGMEATFRVDAWPDQTFTGSVRQVRNAPQVLQNVVTYDAVIDVANPDLRLKPGMTANVTFTTAEVVSVLRLPNAALRFRPPADLVAPAPAVDVVPGVRHRTVWVLRATRPVAVTVTLGITDGTATEILGGELAVGDQVILHLADAETPAPAARRIF